MNRTLPELQLRLLDQCHKFGKHHLGSAFSTLPILKEIYDEMNPLDKIVLSNGHAAAALYVVLEAYRGHDSAALFEMMGDHPKRNVDFGVDCSTGSLGMGITVAVGMALASPEKSVYCVVSDGECAEGSVWEALRFASWRKLENLKIYFNINNFVAYDEIDGARLSKEILAVYPEAQIRFTSLFPFENLSLSAHYIKMNALQYQEMRRILCDQNS
jgi:transketolase